MTTSAQLILPLASLGVGDVAVAGGKGANLGELMRAGLPVPDGFVISTEAYARSAASLDLPTRTARLADPVTHAEAAALRNALAAAPLPDDLGRSLRRACDALGAGPVAVRSSATAEDLPGATFAGQQDTFLDVTGTDAIADAVRRCWASLWTDRAVAYRARLGIHPVDVTIAVVVQRMVRAEVAGVMFTANPVTGRRDETVIEASAGLGEAVVSGAVTPDHVITGPGGRIREQTPAAESPVLTPRECAQLADLGGRIARHYGRPMDIEWAIEGGRTVIVQARPMTALPLPPQRLNRVQRTLSTVLGDYLTARPYPIDMTTWVPRGPVGMMARIVGDVGIGGVFDALYHETEGIVDGARIPMPRPRLRLLTAPWRLPRRARRFPLEGWSADPRLAAFDRVVADLSDLDVASLDWPDLRAQPRRVLDALEPVTGLRFDYLPAAGLALLRLALSLRIRGKGRALPELLQGVRTLTSEGNDRLAEVARLAGLNPATARAVAEGDLEAARRDPGFADAFDRWLADYGYRETTTPILITTPSLGERPTSVLALVALLQSDGSPPAANAQNAATALLRSIRSQRSKARMHGRIDRAAHAVAFREDTHVLFTRLTPALRTALHEIGTRLQSAGVLTAAEDVYHCRLDELEALEAPDGAGAHALTDVVDARSRLRDALRSRPLLNIERGAADARGDALVSGLAGGGGVTTGRVRVIHDVDEFALLRAGDVLVCPVTNPTWTPLFQRAAAVVVDAGGPASHAAIVAREYGLPAVMGTGDATRVLHDGMLVRVDGTAGTVTALADT
ncbi:PEP/pyruvate-binding domain-containing protein [Microbacterium terrisoli]|uniref:PEP/pyruvate-binding domain-containing protein n=1 Tax=Microbacterium terrisoli TaxID=3242192 RepID=UPI002804A60D|nr:PEP/pyruvate-binding domain-containing protein [Microbacterium protaetiae]